MTKTPDTLDRNIDAIAKLRAKHRERRSLPARAAEALGQFFGSVASVYLHAFILISWIGINTGLIKIVPVFDPPPFYFLAVFTCVEAIFLSMFVLIRQNRTMQASEKRSELDLQMSLITEDELTKLVRLTDLIARKLGIDAEREVEDFAETKKEINPIDVVERLEATFEQEH